MRTYNTGTVTDRLRAGSRADVSGCTVWRRYRTPKGYGLITVDGKKRRVHQVAYELVNGPVPPGLEIDHLCRNHACLDPEHLEAVTHRENMLRGVSFNGQKTHCTHGHEFTEANTRWLSRIGGGRNCRTCQRTRARARYAAKHTRKTSIAGGPPAGRDRCAAPD